MKTNDNQISTEEELIKPSPYPKNLLTPALFTTYKGCEQYSDMEAFEIIKSLEKLSAICYNMVHDSNIINIDNQEVVYLNSQQETKLKAA